MPLVEDGSRLLERAPCGEPGQNPLLQEHTSTKQLTNMEGVTTGSVSA